MKDLSPLGGILADPTIRKVFHGSDYDVRSLYRDFGLEVRGLFDTMICAQLLGEEKTGLNDLLSRHVGVTLDKRFQKADWSQRPLPEGMIRYAVEDTRLLSRLAALLEAGLQEKGRFEWAVEEFLLAEQVRPNAASEGPFFLRIKGAGRLDRRGLAILEELARWRDREAHRRDVPPFKVIGADTMMKLAETRAADAAGLTAAGIRGRTAERYGERLLRTVAAAMAFPEEDLPSYPRGERHRRDWDAERRLTRLKSWRTAASERLGMSEGIVINNTMLMAIAVRAPKTIRGTGRGGRPEELAAPRARRGDPGGPGGVVPSPRGSGRFPPHA